MDTPEVAALQSELGSLTCEDEQKLSHFSMMPAHRGKSFEELRLEDYQREAPDDPFIAATKRHWRVTAMNGDALAAANAAFAAVAAECDRLAAAAAGRLAFRAPSPVAALRVTPSKPSFFSASVVEPRVTSDKPFVFGAKLDK